MDLPIVLLGAPSQAPDSITATTSFANTTETIHLSPMLLPAFPVDFAMLSADFDLNVDAHVAGASLAFPITMHALSPPTPTATLAKRQNAVTVSPFTLPAMNINFEGVKEGVKFGLDTPLRDIKISFPAVQINKRQVTFFDEVMDIGVEIGSIVINMRREVAGMARMGKRQASLFGGAVVVDDVTVTVGIGGNTITVPIVG